MTEDLRQIIESLLFVAETPLTVERLKQILAGTESGEIRGVLKTLHSEYLKSRRGFYLTEIAGGYQFRTRPEYNAYIRRMLKPNTPRLSKAALETLAIIAYKQPVIRSDIEHIRGVDCGGVLRLLLERKLIRILGRKEIPGRPLVYATTKAFLEVFDLKDLKDLPTPKEIEEMGQSSAINPLSLQVETPVIKAENPEAPVETAETPDGVDDASPEPPATPTQATEISGDNTIIPEDGSETRKGDPELSPDTLENSEPAPVIETEDFKAPEDPTATGEDTPESSDITPEVSEDIEGKKT